MNYMVINYYVKFQNISRNIAENIWLYKIFGSILIIKNKNITFFFELNIF